MSEALGIASSLGAALCWTATAALLKIATVKTQPLLANATRVAAGTVGSLALVFLLNRVDELFKPDLVAFSLAVLAGILGVVLGDSLYIYALKLAGVSRAVPVANTYPLFTTLLAFIFLGEAVSPLIVAGALTVVAGLWLISPRVEEPLNHAGSRKGFLVALSCAPIWGAGITLLGYALNFYSFVALNAVRLPLITLILFLASYARGFSILTLDRRTALLLALTGILGLTIGNIAFLLGIEEIGVARAVPLSSTSPLFATIIGLFLGEKVTAKIFLSAALIVLGIAQITLG